MSVLSSGLQAAFAKAGLYVTRLKPNRFDAMSETMHGIAARGFVPTIVVDGGANVGNWTRMAVDVFPAARFHVIEPQPACGAALAVLERAYPTVQVHRVAASRPRCDRVRMADATAGSTGARVLLDGEPAEDERWLPAATLDDLVADTLRPDDRVLLKLDIEGHELDALLGATRLLPSVHVVVIEVQFYAVNWNALPTFLDVALELNRLGFEMYDVAALGSRPRDGRLRIGDVVFVRQDGALASDRSWE